MPSTGRRSTPLAVDVPPAPSDANPIDPTTTPFTVLPRHTRLIPYGRSGTQAAT